MIIERLEEYGVQINEVISAGGIANKNPVLLQIYADILGRPIKAARSSQTCALGAAIFGAVVGKAYKDVPGAQLKMTGLKKEVFKPRPKEKRVYDRLFRLYRMLHDSFGIAGTKNDLSGVMKEMLKIKAEARK